MIVEVTVDADPVDWNVDYANYEMSMSVIAEVYFDEALITDTNDVLSVMIDHELRGTASIREVSGHYLAYMNVWGNQSDLGEMVDFRFWDASQGQEYDASTTLAIDFRIDTVWGTSAAPVQLNIYSTENRARYIYLDAGWNLVSFNALPEDASLASVFATLDLTDGDLIKDHNTGDMAQYDVASGTWITAGIDSIVAGYGYWLYCLLYTSPSPRDA